MADSLDDFFAKKDKNKKTKKKNISTEELAKKLEESGKSREKNRKTKDKTNTSALINNTSEQEDEEWNDFEEEREKDYSGLRIQTLSIKDKEEELREQQLQDIEEDKQKDGILGPWKTSAPETDAEADKDKPSEEPVITPNMAAVTTGETIGSQQSRYIPPHLRAGAQTGGTTLSPVSMTSTRRSKSGAPKIQDITEFPTLGTNESLEDNKGFQTVRYGNSRETMDRSSPNVTLDNKYGLLNTSKELQNSE